jgi:glutamate racemase
MEYVGPDVRVIDSGVAIARRALSVLQAAGLQRERTEPGSFRLLTTAPPEETSRVATALLGRQITAEQVTP